MTHYSVEDITIALSLPNMQIFSPADPVEGVACLRYAIQSNRLSYIRIAKSGEKKLHTNTVDITHPIYLHKSSSQNILLLHGSIADEIDLILEELDINVVSVPFINADIDWEMFLKPYKYIFTLEEHFIDGGFGSYLRDKVERKVHKFGIPNHYIHTIGDRDYLRDYFEIDGENIVRKIKDILKGS
jgi:transketolase